MKKRSNYAKLRQIKFIFELRIVKLNDRIRKNEEEYEDLLENKDLGQFVDDLISQNRYTAQKLEKDKNNAEYSKKIISLSLYDTLV